jgi:hypothetical protein
MFRQCDATDTSGSGDLDLGKLAVRSGMASVYLDLDRYSILIATMKPSTSTPAPSATHIPRRFSMVSRIQTP